MTSERIRFADFVLDVRDRRLSRGGVAVELNARYLDALMLLTREAGTLVTKDRFHDEVWRGVPVTDEALTQCIKTLRRQLGDDAARPRFIETVPKHGYRFIAPIDGEADAPVAVETREWRRTLLLAGAGTIGGGIAGMMGGFVYGFAGGSASALLVLLCLSIGVAVTGAAGVALGIAVAGFGGERWWQSVVGGAVGGMVVGAVVKLLGVDAFNLLFGQAPAGITGGGEGAILGGAVGLGAWLATRPGRSLRIGATFAALCGGAAGLVATLLGGKLMAGSLDLLARQFPGSRLRMDGMGRVFGESGLGPIAQAVTGALEGGLFAGCLVAAMVLARRDLERLAATQP